jgi:hypothetical protein
MFNAAFTDARIGETKTELERLRTEIRAWHNRRLALDKQKQYATQLRLILEVLGKALENVETAAASIGAADAAPAWKECRRLDRALVWVRRLWTFFRSRFDQRDEASMGPVLAAADEIVWSCYAEPFRNARLTPGAAPLPYIENRFSPQATPRVDPPPDLKSDVDAAFLTSYLAELPVAVIGLPPACLEHPWELVYLAHETAHHVQYDLVNTPRWGLVTTFGDGLAAAVSNAPGRDAAAGARWKAWGREVFADVCSVLTVGPAALWGILALEFADESELIRRKPAYPAPVVRLALMAGVLEKLGVKAEPGLRGVDPASYRTGGSVQEGPRDLRAEVAQDLALVGAAVEWMASTTILDTNRLDELCGWAPDAFADRDGARVKDWSLALLMNVCETEATAGREARRLALKTTTLTLISACREEGTRAARAPAADPRSLGEQLAALVLNAPPV